MLWSSTRPTHTEKGRDIHYTHPGPDFARTSDATLRTVAEDEKAMLSWRFRGPLVLALGLTIREPLTMRARLQGKGAPYKNIKKGAGRRGRQWEGKRGKAARRGARGGEDPPPLQGAASELRHSGWANSSGSYDYECSLARVEGRVESLVARVSPLFAQSRQPFPNLCIDSTRWRGPPLAHGPASAQGKPLNLAPSEKIPRLATRPWLIDITYALPNATNARVLVAR